MQFQHSCLFSSRDRQSLYEMDIQGGLFVTGDYSKTVQTKKAIYNISYFLTDYQV